MSRIITVTSGKGGVGKSSISVNLAIALAHQNLKVCLIDGDFGLKNLDVMMGLENRVVYDVNVKFIRFWSKIKENKRFIYYQRVKRCLFKI